MAFSASALTLPISWGGVGGEDHETQGHQEAAGLEIAAAAAGSAQTSPANGRATTRAVHGGDRAHAREPVSAVDRDDHVRADNGPFGEPGHAGAVPPLPDRDRPCRR